ncbi:MAG: hypothetical protein ABIR18_08935 [Chitinophagaceae bacterium]
MTYIKNNKALVFVIAVLLLSNIAMLYFFLKKEKCNEGNKKPVGAREYMAEKLKNEVGFTDSQIAKYKELSGKHKESMRPLFEEIGLAKDSLYKLLLQEPSDSTINHYLEMIGEKQEAIDKRIFNHFLTLKHICTPDQETKYDSVIQRAIKGMINPRRGGGGDKKKEENKK